MSVGSEEKIICYKSVRVQVIILITWILTDTRKSKNYQKKIKFGWKLEISIGRIIMIPRKRNVYLWKCEANFFTTPACTCTAGSKVIQSSHNPGFICWKHMQMQISCKPVVQACKDFEILMFTSKGEQIDFKFLFIQFRLVK